MARIAIVDDSPLVRTIFAAALRRGGHDPEEIEPLSVFEVFQLLPPELVGEQHGWHA